MGRREVMLKVGIQEEQGQCEGNSSGRLLGGGELSLLTPYLGIILQLLNVHPL